MKKLWIINIDLNAFFRCQKNQNNFHLNLLLMLIFIFTTNFHCWFDLLYFHHQLLLLVWSSSLFSSPTFTVGLIFFFFILQNLSSQNLFLIYSIIKKISQTANQTVRKFDFECFNNRLCLITSLELI